MGTYDGFNVPVFTFEKERKKAMKKAIKFAGEEKEEKNE